MLKVKIRLKHAHILVFVVQLMFACLILICLFVYLLEGLALKLIYLFAYFTVFVLFILFVSLVHFLFV